jgi:putative oxygen-independent coproporphyrinogen III oxidase
MRLQLENQVGSGLAGLYIHVPFCLRKCRYCDFYSVTDMTMVEVFVHGVEKEVLLLDNSGGAFDTIYLGGGTPSVLSPLLIGRIMKAVKDRFSFAEKTEITIEANPGTVSLEGLEAWADCGINRVNMGIQSFHDGRLRFLGRLHSAEDARRAIRTARDAGIMNLGLDLIYGLPYQTPQQWLEELKEAVGYEPEHLSCYMLTYEPGTTLHRWSRNDRFSRLEDDMVADLFDVTINFLRDSGYEQYEISNFSREKAFRSKHNQKYWNHTRYVGLGPAAHSFVNSKRSWNHADLGRYVRDLASGIRPVGGSELLDTRRLMLEAVYLGLRTTDGIDPGMFKKRYQVDFADYFAPALEALRDRGLLKLVLSSSCRFALTQQGRAFADAIAGVFAEHVATKK